jgi:protein TonB
MLAESDVRGNEWGAALLAAAALHVLLVSTLPEGLAPDGDRAGDGTPTRITSLQLGGGGATRGETGPARTPGPQIESMARDAAAAPSAAPRQQRARSRTAPEAPEASEVQALPVPPVVPAPRVRDDAPGASEAPETRAAVPAAVSAPGVSGAPGGLASGAPAVGEAGGGGALSAGTSGGADTGRRRDYFDGLYARVVDALDYPRRARLEQIEGTVLLEMRIDRRGRLTHCAVAESSGSTLLDRHAVRIARRAAPFDAVPSTFSEADLSFELPLEFSLRD